MTEQVPGSRQRGLAPWGPIAALQFLTRIPIALRRAPSMEGLVVWFPVAGAVIGAIAGGLAALTTAHTTVLLGAAVAVVVGLLVTGAFHEDGLGDVADGFGGGTTVERRLEIMKDSRHGTYGVAAMTASIVVRFAAYASLTGAGDLFVAVVVVHVLARSAAVVLMAVARPVRHSGLGRDYGQTTTVWRAALALGLGMALTLGMAGWWALIALGAALAGAAVTGLLAWRKIGGISGDVLGAAEQVAECAVAISAVAVLV